MPDRAAELASRAAALMDQFRAELPDEQDRLQAIAGEWPYLLRRHGLALAIEWLDRAAGKAPRWYRGQVLASLDPQLDLAGTLDSIAELRTEDHARYACAAITCLRRADLFLYALKLHAVDGD